MTSNCSDGFTLVTKSHPLCAKRGNRHLSASRNSAVHPTKCRFNGNFDIFSQQLENARKIVQDDPRFLVGTLTIFQDIQSKGKTCVCLVCYGLGHFCSTKTSLYQLALLCELKEFLKPDTVLVGDPIFSDFERRWLEYANLKLLKKNDHCLRTVENCTKGFTVFYMPHAGWPMYNNVLYANWSGRKLEKTIIFGNSFESLLNLHRERAEAELKFVVKAGTVSREKKIPGFHRCQNAFSDLAVHCFDVKGLKKDFFKNNEGPPVYEEFYADTIL